MKTKLNYYALDLQVKDWFSKCKNITKSYDRIIEVERLLNSELGEYTIKQVNIPVEGRSGNTYHFRAISESIFGAGANEDLIFDVLSHNCNNIFQQHPNGKMNFPDAIIDGIKVDFKAVKCDIHKRNNNFAGPQWASSLGTTNWADAIAASIYDNKYDITKNSDAASLICLTFYYINEDGDIVVDGFKIVPTVFYIGKRADRTNWSTKSAREGSLVSGKLTVVNDTTCESYINNMLDVYVNRINKIMK